MLKFAIILVCCALFGSVKADTPANCSYEDIRGSWVLHEGARGQSKDVDCSKAKIVSATLVRLDFPDIATDENGNVGYWTLIYNQGFEVVINNRKYFAFSSYTGSGKNVTSMCSTTSFGWAHETGVNPSDWSCYLGAKVNTSETDKHGKVMKTLPYSGHAKLYSMLNGEQIVDEYHKNTYYEKNMNFVETINKVQNKWQAAHYDFMEKMTISDLIRMAGGKKSTILGKPKPAKVTPEQEKLASMLPAAFDWRNVSGVNYVSPIRNQGACGSCYAFSAMGMNEARLRVKTFNAKKNIFSPQDIVECSEYSQGCDGGFPYLIGGKYAEDFGLVDEQCNPYQGKDGACHTNKTCSRTYSTSYHYVGGFYGGCNEAVMKIELLRSGPMSVAFEVYDDFFHYKSGIYHHTSMSDKQNYKFSPFELTNHAVLLVGYGTANTGEDYWIVKNSWGEGWGESGYFKIRRGTDECALESIAVGSEIVV